MTAIDNFVYGDNSANKEGGGSILLLIPALWCFTKNILIVKQAFFRKTLQHVHAYLFVMTGKFLISIFSRHIHYYN